MSCFRYYLSLILVSTLFAASAKENKDLVRANYYYSHYAYFEAIPYFEKVAGELNTADVYSQLADCYMVTNNLEKAAGAYSKAVNIAGCSNAVRLKYAQLLMELGNYDEAAKWLNEYQKNTTPERRITNLLAGCSSAKDRMAAMPEGTASLLPFNTEGSDFAPT
jgi:predicted Zn-dependent protease